MYKLELKSIYTTEELTKYKIPNDKEEARERKVARNLLNIMFEKICGNPYTWAKAHDLEDLHVCHLFAFKSKEELDEFKKTGAKIINKQLNKPMGEALGEMEEFIKTLGVVCLNNEGDAQDMSCMTENNFKRLLRMRIRKFEDKHGKLKYKDKYEKELKEYCEFRKKD